MARFASTIELQKIINDDLVVPSLIGYSTNKMYKEFNRSVDNVLKEAFVKVGIDIDDLGSISGRFTRIVKDGDKFDHFFIDYGKPNEKRIVSIERMPEIKQDGNKYTVSCKFY